MSRTRDERTTLSDGQRAAGRPRGARRTAGGAAGLLLLLLAAAPPASSQDLEGRGTDGADYPYVPTPTEVVAEMLEMADVSASDTVYDLGSGDGRIVITAARRYGASGLGVELDSSLVADARQNAADEGVSDRVRMVRGDLFEVDLSPATVVTLYLLPRTMRKLQSKLFDELRPGARIVAHDFDMPGWSPDSVARTPGGLGGHATLYYWRVPARVGGTWEVAPPGGDTLRVRIDQRFQEIRARVSGRAPGVEVSGERVTGDSVRLRITPVSGGEPRTLAGSVSGDVMSGRTAGGEGWGARRVARSDPSFAEWQSGASEADSSGAARRGTAAGGATGAAWSGDVR